MKYLFVSGHTDDAELSCGGTMIKLSEAGHSVTHIAASWCGLEELPDEFGKANDILGVKSYCHGFKVRYFFKERGALADLMFACAQEYEFIFTHSPLDKHLDHRIIAEESIRVFKHDLITYIGPLNGEETPNYFVELSEQHLEKKIKALACYKSQSDRRYMDPEFIRAQAIYNGIKAGRKYAEAFKIHRMIG